MLAPCRRPARLPGTSVGSTDSAASLLNVPPPPGMMEHMSEETPKDGSSEPPIYSGSFDLMAWLLGAVNRNVGGFVLFNLGSTAIALLVMLSATFCAGMTTGATTGRTAGCERSALISEPKRIDAPRCA